MSDFHEKIIKLGDDFVLKCYAITKKFPSEERYALAAQLRRASTSIVLNYVEGRAKRSDGNYGTHMNSAYGSLKEVLYIIHLGVILNYIKPEEGRLAQVIGDELGAMLYKLKSDHYDK